MAFGTILCGQPMYMVYYVINGRSRQYLVEYIEEDFDMWCAAYLSSPSECLWIIPNTMEADQ